MFLDTSINWAALEAEQEKEKAKTKRNSNSKIAVIDAETDPFNGIDFVEPFIWGFYDGEIYKEFSGPYCTENLIDYIKDFKGAIYAHNGGKFDFHFLLDSIKSGTKLHVINGRIAKFKLGKAMLKDSYCILPSPLSAMAKDEFDYSILEKDKRYLPGNFERIQKYLKSDCVNLFDNVKRFIDSYGNKLTLAGSALEFYKELGGTIPKSNKRYYDKFQPFYYGGRVQPFETGIIQSPVRVFDIKSAYPFAMLSNHPITTEYYETRNPRECLYEQTFFDLECETLKGCFPYRRKDGLAFPIGKGRFRVTGWEMVKALETDSIRNVKILNAYVFEDVTTFEEYVNYFYNLKLQAEQKGDKTERLFAKLFLNSLYGKFGSNPNKYSEYYLYDYGEFPLDPEIKEDETEDEYLARKWSPSFRVGDKQLFERPLPPKMQRFYNVATAASITGFVRAYLFDAINKCEGVLYCDTDSIICAGRAELPLGDELGQWECECQGESIAIAAKKIYAVYNGKGNTIKSASKGVKLTGEEIAAVAGGNEITWKSESESFSITMPKQFISRRVNFNGKKWDCF